MSAKRNVTCVGELIADLYTDTDGSSFRPSGGGAAANVAVGLAKLGVPSAFAGKVGDDSFGRFLVKELRKARVDARGIVIDPEHRTRLAFVRVAASGARVFEFWEKHPADEQLRQSDINQDAIRRSAIVHISSFLLRHEPSRSAALSLARARSRSGGILSFDPNVRLPLWPSAAEARRILLRMVSYATVLRLNAEEATLLTQKRNFEAAARDLQAFGPPLVVITMGAGGCYLLSGATGIFVDGFPVRAVDTTGCGDAFLAGLLAGLYRSRAKPEALSEAQLRSLGRFANAAGALTALKRGVFPALPTLARVRAFLKAHPE
jgi:fructokinase